MTPKTRFKTQLPEALAAAAARVRMVGESDSQFVRLAIAEEVAARLRLDDIPPEWLEIRSGPSRKVRLTGRSK